MDLLLKITNYCLSLTSNFMSKSIKTLVILVVLVVIIILGFIWYQSSSGGPVNTIGTDNSGAMDNSSASNPTDNSVDSGLTTSPSDNSDAALNSDLNSADSQMNSVNADASSTDASLNQ